ncbi:MAG: class I SAM-dependent methyltransferase [Planctomycetes bacterium]|nr:class I SAM-dependent methyltransferase [Planctomycetota bacterium]
MLPRVLEPEVMDSAEEAHDYDAMDHAAVNAQFVTDLRAAGLPDGPLLDLGTGTAQIPIELCRREPTARVVATDLARHMLALARENVARAGLTGNIELRLGDGKRLGWPDGSFATVMSNSIVHHIPEPARVLAEALRVARRGGLLFFRDLLRPDDDAGVRWRVETYAAGANERQRALFDASLRAALTLAEVRALVRELGLCSECVQATSDRHWTLSARVP